MKVQLTGESNRPEQDPDTKHGFVFEPVRDVEVWSIRRAHLFDGSCCREDFSVPSTESVDRKGISMIFEGIFFNICESDAKYVHLISYLIAAVSIWRRSPKGGHRCGVIFRWFFCGEIGVIFRWLLRPCSEFFVFFHQRLPLSPFDDDRPREAIDASNCSEETLLHAAIGVIFRCFFVVRSEWFLLVVFVFFFSRQDVVALRLVARSDWFFVGFLSDSTQINYQKEL